MNPNPEVSMKFQSITSSFERFIFRYFMNSDFFPVTTINFYIMLSTDSNGPILFQWPGPFSDDDLVR